MKSEIKDLYMNPFLTKGKNKFLQSPKRLKNAFGEKESEKSI